MIESLRCPNCGWTCARPAREGGTLVGHRSRAFLIRANGDLVVECAKCRKQMSLRVDKRNGLLRPRLVLA
jgi:ssDNA-binding Zn-finger/Zn-ribbon topoisomerase 1